jgi:hypothetical protein
MFGYRVLVNANLVQWFESDQLKRYVATAMGSVAQKPLRITIIQYEAVVNDLLRKSKTDW